MRVTWLLLLAVLVGACDKAEKPQEFIAMGEVCEDKAHGPRLWVGTSDLMMPPRCGGSDLIGWDWSKVTGEQKSGATRWGTFVVIGGYDPAKDAMTLTRPPIPLREYKGDPPIGESDEADFKSPCKKPPGGWRVLDPSLTTQESLDKTTEAAESRPDYGSLWIDDSPNPVKDIKTDEDELRANDPTKLILNVAVTGDQAAAEADIRKTWGGALCVSRQKHTDRELRKIQDSVVKTPGMLSAGAGHDFVELEVVWDDGTLQSKLDKNYGRGLVKVTSAIRRFND